MNRARYYDPYSQKFLSEDPTGFDGKDLNLYRYVFNAPLALKDPYGEFAWGLPVAIGILIPIIFPIEDLNKSPMHGKDRKTFMDTHQDMIIPGDQIFNELKDQKDSLDIPYDPRFDPFNPSNGDITLKPIRACS